MKKIFLLLAAACVTLSAAADEGMWMLPYLQKMNSKDMKARGCKLSAEEIYSMNNSSLKDAIVIFGGGCTPVFRAYATRNATRKMPLKSAYLLA